MNAGQGRENRPCFNVSGRFAAHASVAFDGGNRDFRNLCVGPKTQNPLPVLIRNQNRLSMRRRVVTNFTIMAPPV